MYILYIQHLVQTRRKSTPAIIINIEFDADLYISLDHECLVTEMSRMKSNPTNEY